MEAGAGAGAGARAIAADGALGQSEQPPPAVDPPPLTGRISLAALRVIRVWTEGQNLLKAVRAEMQTEQEEERRQRREAQAGKPLSSFSQSPASSCAPSPFQTLQSPVEPAELQQASAPPVALVGNGTSSPASSIAKDKPKFAENAETSAAATPSPARRKRRQSYGRESGAIWASAQAPDDWVPIRSVQGISMDDSSRGKKKSSTAKSSKRRTSGPTVAPFFAGMTFFLVPLGSRMRQNRRELFSDRIAEAGGQVESEFGGRKDTFVIADASVSSFAEVWGSHGAPARILKDAWLSKCLQQKQLVPPEDGEEIIVVSSTDQKDVAGQTAKGCQQLQQGLTSDVASKFSWLKKKGGGETAPRRLSFACQKSGTKELLKPSPNKVICDIYTELAGLLKSCPLKASDVWGAKNRSKVAAALGLLDQPVTCGADAASAVKGCGPKLQTEINEIIMTGKLELLENVRANPKVTAIRELTSIHGVGSKTALSLYERGFQSVASLRTDRGQEILTWQQKIGVEYYEDIQQRIPRTEVKEILERVRLEAEKLCPGVDCEAMGSFRRGKESCGDVDILISPPPGQENCNVLRALLESLRTAGFISADLNHPHEHVPGKSESWMGICRLGPDRLHRRVDIKVYPRSQLAYARLYFTGSDHFNRSMRHYARHVLSMTLSDRHLASCMIKNGVREWIGPSFDCETEKDVFDRMGLEYRKPTERNVYESFVAGLSDDEDEEEAGGIVAAAAGAGEEEEGK